MEEEGVGGGRFTGGVAVGGRRFAGRSEGETGGTTLPSAG